MAQVVALDTLLAARTLWHAGRGAALPADGEPTGHAALDALLPQGGWPRRALTELLLPVGDPVERGSPRCSSSSASGGQPGKPGSTGEGAGYRRPLACGMGELSLLLPTLARLTGDGGTVALVAPPYIPYAPAWQDAGVDLAGLQVIEAAPRDALWAFEQCLRSGACAAVLGWPVQADAAALRRLQVAADSGACLGFALRDRRHAVNASPAALRLEFARDAHGTAAWHVRKCRGGPAPARAFAPGAA